MNILRQTGIHTNPYLVIYMSAPLQTFFGMLNYDHSSMRRNVVYMTHLCNISHVSVHFHK